MTEERIAMSTLIWAINCGLHVPFYLFFLWRMKGNRFALYFGTAFIMIGSFLFNLMIWLS